jgi:hypothetical protein
MSRQLNLQSVAPSRFHRWLNVVLFAVAMAWMESAVVLYLRTLSEELDPYAPFHVPLSPGILRAEMIREAATLVMLALVGWFAGHSRQSRLALFIVAFGTWDIFYYVFLVPLTGWPRSVLDWDILFLLPLPWWGPVLSPALIALLMIAGGTLVALCDTPERSVYPSRRAMLIAAAGCVVALYVFMEDSLRLLSGGSANLMNLRPQRFDWPLFLPALALMSVPVLELAWRARPLKRVDGDSAAIKL